MGCSRRWTGTAPRPAAGGRCPRYRRATPGTTSTNPRFPQTETNTLGFSGPVILSSFKPAGLHQQRFSVDFEYPVVFCRGALAPTEASLIWCIRRREPERRHAVFAVLDGGLVDARPQLPREVESYVAAHAQHLELVAPPLTLQGGER